MLLGIWEPGYFGSSEGSSAGRTGAASSPKIWYLLGFPIPWSPSEAGLQLVRRQEHPSSLPREGSPLSQAEKTAASPQK